MLDDVLAIPDHLRDALWRVETARIVPADSIGMLVCGMGGSAIGGDLARDALGDRLTRPLHVIRSYRIPSWVTADWTILFSSYSGDTEETLACFSAAEAIGARRIVASTGGPLVEGARAAGVPVIGLPGILSAPRAAVAYMLVCATEVATLAGAAPNLHDEIEGAAVALEGRLGETRERAGQIAKQLEGKLPVVYGAGPTSAVARRWKTQLNENAKIPAFWGELPEVDHNELCGWGGGAAPGGSAAAVLLEDPDQHPRERRRFELTAAAIADGGAPAIRIEASGGSRGERAVWAVILGDLVSLELADARGVDPLSIEAIDSLKSALADS
jgi:glucose/mannose-6-phosphate isomerase